MGSSEHRCVLTGQLPDQEEHAVRDHGPPHENQRDPSHDPAAGAPDRTYTFGDGDGEAARLALVTKIFGPTSEELLTQVVEDPPVLAYDLGCGPGHTTRLVARATGAALTVGLERSAAHLARARAGAPKGVRFVTWDVAELPFPTGPADLVYTRLLLAHLQDPVAVALSWATQLNVGGLLVVDELEWISTDHPVLQAHLRLASSLVATTGAQMCAGPVLAGLGVARSRRVLCGSGRRDRSLELSGSDLVRLSGDREGCRVPRDQQRRPAATSCRRESRRRASDEPVAGSGFEQAADRPVGEIVDRLWPQPERG